MVSTIASTFEGADKIVVGPDSNYYISMFGMWTGTRGSGSSILKVTPDGDVSTYIDGLVGPVGGLWDVEGNYYFLDKNNGVRGFIKRYSAAGELTTIAEVPGWPADVAIDELGDMYISNFLDRRIDRIPLGGELETFIEDDRLDAVVGLEYDSGLGLFGASFNDGRVFEIGSSGALTELVDLKGQVGYITFFKDHLYVSDLTGHRILKVDLNGNASLLAGTGQLGSADNSGDLAEFNLPNGITSDAESDQLIISENGGMGSVRVIGLMP